MKAGLLVLVFGVGCGSGGGRPDAGPPGSPDASTFCADLQAEYDVELARVGKTCETVMDCAIVGGMVRPTCSGAPYLGSCSGSATNKLAYRGSRAAAIEVEFAEACADVACGAGVECVADCAPADDVRCEGHVCVTVPPWCLSPPDAGVDAAP